MEDIVIRIKEYMDRHGYNPSEFADLLNMNRSSLLHMLSGRNKPNLQLIKSMLELDGDIDLKYLLLGIQSADLTERKTDQSQLQIPVQADKIQTEPEPKQYDKKEIDSPEKVFVLKSDGTYSTYVRELP